MNFLEEKFEFIYLSQPITVYLAKRIVKEDRRIIAICGASGSGKTTFAKELLSLLGIHKALLLSVDDYWRYTRKQARAFNLTGYDWEMRDKEKFLSDLQSLSKFWAIEKPIYDYEREMPTSDTEHIEPRERIILEATLDFQGIADCIIFLHAPDEILLQRRLKRDKGKTSFANKASLEDYIRSASLPAYHEKHLPLAHHADFFIDTHENRLYQHRYP